MGRRNNRIADITSDELPADWEIAKTANARVEVMTTRVHGLQGKDKTRAERRSRKQADKVRSGRVADLMEDNYR